MKKEEEPKEHQTPGWLLTYGDMVTLLVTFFVMLISLSTINVDKYKEAMSKVQAYMGGEAILEGSKKPLEKLNEQDMHLLEFPAEESQDLTEREQFIKEEEIVQYVRDYFSETELEKYIVIEEVKIGYLITIPMDICFDRGDSILTWEANAIFKKVGHVLRKIRGKVIVDTNVGNVAWLRYKYQAEKDLLIERAVRICDYLLSVSGIDERRLSIAGNRISQIEDIDKIGLLVLKKMV